MTIEILGVTKNDLQPYYYAQIKDSDDAVVDITDATIVCTMRLVDGSVAKIDRQSTGINITDAANGKFEYQWQGADTDTPGLYNIEFEVTPTTGGKITFPNAEKQGRAQVQIKDSLDNT